MPGPIPDPTPTDRPYWEAAKDGKLLLQQCGGCGHLLFPPGAVCPKCLSADLTWKEMSGRGRIWSWVRMHRPYFPGMPPPYVVVRVKLDEGPAIMTNLVDSDESAIAMDAPVEVVFVPAGDGAVLPQFRLA